jgi:hypothetical protein
VKLRPSGRASASPECPAKSCRRSEHLRAPERLGAVMVAVLAGIEGLLGMRFLLHAYGANPSSGFVNFIDGVSWLFARPFANAFSNRSWSQGVVEISTLVAMGFYLVLFAFIAMLITALAPRLRGRTGGGA